MTKTMRKILLITAVLFCVLCFVLVCKGIDVRVILPFAAASMALMNMAVLHP